MLEKWSKIYPSKFLTAVCLPLCTMFRTTCLWSFMIESSSLWELHQACLCSVIAAAGKAAWYSACKYVCLSDSAVHRKYALVPCTCMNDLHVYMYVDNRIMFGQIPRGLFTQIGMFGGWRFCLLLFCCLMMRVTILLQILGLRRHHVCHCGPGAVSRMFFGKFVATVNLRK